MIIRAMYRTNASHVCLYSLHSILFVKCFLSVWDRVGLNENGLYNGHCCCLSIVKLTFTSLYEAVKGGQGDGFRKLLITCSLSLITMRQGFSSAFTVSCWLRSRLDIYNFKARHKFSKGSLTYTFVIIIISLF